MLYGRHVRSARHDAEAGEWIVRATNRGSNDDEEYRFDALVLSDKLLVLPNPYAVLPKEEWGPLELPASLASEGTIVLMLALEQAPDDESPAVIMGAQLDAPLRLLVHDSAKPMRASAHDRPLDLWVAHSTAAYADMHLQGNDPPGLDDEDAVLAEMQAAALSAIMSSGGDSCNEAAARIPTVAFASAFAWDHAQPADVSRLASTHLLDIKRRAGVCGDFFAGPDGLEGVEAAAMSGIALADALMPQLVASAAPADMASE